MIASRYFAHAFSAACIFAGSISPGLPPIFIVTRPPSNCGSGMSMPFSRMQRAKSSIALRFCASLVAGAPEDEAGSSPPPQAASETVAAQAANNRRVFMPAIAPGGNETAFSRT